MNKLYIAFLSVAMLALFFYFRANAQLPTLDATLYTNEGVFYAKGDPTPQPNKEHLYGLHNAIIDVINNANDSLDIALYGLNSQAVVDAIIEARNRGVAVRIVGHGEYTTHRSYGGFYGQLQASSIPFVLSDGDGLMHNKFIIADGQRILTGSTNFTRTGLFYNLNNVMVVDSERIAGAYTCKFQEMFIDRRFGLNAESSCGGVFEFADGVTVEVIFTPNQGEYYINEIVSDVLPANEVYIDTFYLTLDQLGEALQTILENGVPVHAIIDENGFNGSGDEVKKLCDLDIGLNSKTTNTGGKNHGKTILILQEDGTKVIWLGSTNFSRSGTVGSELYGANDENTLRIKGADWLFDQYQEYFWRVFNELPSHQFCRVTNAENNIPACADGHDNDHDGFIDVIDYNCNEATLDTCQDGIDNDGDSFIDEDDYGCWMIERLCPADPPMWLVPKVNEDLLNLRWTPIHTDGIAFAYEIYGSNNGKEWHLILSTTFTDWTVPKELEYRFVRLGSLGCLDMPQGGILEIEYPYVVGRW